MCANVYEWIWGPPWVTCGTLRKLESGVASVKGHQPTRTTAPKQGRQPCEPTHHTLVPRVPNNPTGSQPTFQEDPLLTQVAVFARGESRTVTQNGLRPAPYTNPPLNLSCYYCFPYK